MDGLSYIFQVVTVDCTDVETATGEQVHVSPIGQKFYLLT